MVAKLIDGKSAASELRRSVATEVQKLKGGKGITPGLAVVLVGEDPASQVYVRSKGVMATEVGMASFEFRLPESASDSDLLEILNRLNEDAAVHGILVQLPLPKHLNTEVVIGAIAPEKDVDGFHVSNVGRLGTGQAAMVPCTPLGCLILLREQLGSLVGMHAVVIGRSNIVGKPMAQLLLAESCTVTVAHSKTRNLSEICRQADILVAAIGRPEAIPGDWIKPRAVVIDVGINRIERDGRSRLVGDVDLEGAMEVAGAITPVPGGVGPMTIACLLANTLTACLRLNRLGDSDGFPAFGRSAPRN